MNSTTDQLFVYGSLRSGFHDPAYHYLSRYFHLVGEGQVSGKLYDMGGYPVAVPGSGEGFIPGELYAINNPLEFAWAMAQLDDYEGLHVETGEPCLYKRDLVNVHIEDRETQAWIYWYCGDITGRKEISAADLVQFLQQKNKH